MDSFTHKFPNARFIHVFPKKSQGSFFDGTLDFDPRNANRRINEGYYDMKHQIEMLNNIDKSLSDRNEDAEEIHIYSGKYYGSLTSILSNANVANTDDYLLEDSDFRFDDLDKELSDLSNRLKGNAQEMDKFVLEGVTHISAMDAQMNELHRSKGFKKLWNSISGKNKRLKQGIDNNLINAQQATTKMIYKLVETDAMSVELIRTVQSQLQGATIKMGHVLEQHGYAINSIKDDYKQIAKLYGELILQDQEIASEINGLYKLFFDNTKYTDDKFADIESKIAAIEDVQRLQNWHMNIKYQSFGRTEYQHLDLYKKVVCVASDFFYITKGKWDDQLILHVKGALDNLDISPDEIISYNELIYELMIDNSLREYLFDRNGVRIYSSNSDDDIIPHYEALVDGICIGERVLVSGDINVETWISNFMTDRTGENNLQGNTSFNVICELLIILMQYEGKQRGEELLPAYRDIKKAALLGDVEAECRYARLLLEHNHIEDAFNMILDMENRGVSIPSFDSVRDRAIELYASNI